MVDMGNFVQSYISWTLQPMNMGLVVLDAAKI